MQNNIIILSVLICIIFVSGCIGQTSDNNELSGNGVLAWLEDNVMCQHDGRPDCVETFALDFTLAERGTGNLNDDHVYFETNITNIGDGIIEDTYATLSCSNGEESFTLNSGDDELVFLGVDVELFFTDFYTVGDEVVNIDGNGTILGEGALGMWISNVVSMPPTGYATININFENFLNNEQISGEKLECELSATSTEPSQTITRDFSVEFG
jgi:hypothetical protein